MSIEIGRRVAKGAAWTVGSRFAIRGIGLVSTVVLARLLLPEDFGLVAVAAALMGALDTFGNFSFDLALIREGRASRDHYDTVWTLTVLRGALVAAALVVLARPANDFFNDQRVASIVYVLAATTFISGFENVGIVDFRKDLNFHRDFWLQVFAKFASFVTVLTLAFLWRNYWALVGGIIANRLGTLILSYRMHPYRPWFSLREWRSLMNFSKWLLTSNIVTFIGRRLDTFVVGRIAGAHALGLYEISSEIADLPTGELIAPIQRALYPGYAKLAEDRDRMSDHFLRGFAMIIMAALPAAVGIATVAELIIGVFLGQRWIEALPLLQVLAIAGILKVCGANSGSALLALGKARLLSHLATLLLGLVAVFVVAGTLVAGVIGAAYGIVCAMVVILIFHLHFTMKILAISLARLVQTMWRSAVSAALMAVVVRMLMVSWPPSPVTSEAMTQLFVTSGIGAVVYVAAHLALWRLAGSPDGAERDVLSTIAPLARSWRAALGW